MTVWSKRARRHYGRGIAGIAYGDGPAVVLIHGVGLTADSWGAQFDRLSRDYALHALDLPGHGESQPLPLAPGDASVASFADHLAQAIESIGGPVHIVGHSLGALIALDLAVRYPQFCASVAALNAIYRRSAAAAEAVKARAASLPLTGVSDPTGTLTRWFGTDLSAPAAQACNGWLSTVNAEAYKTAYTAFAQGDSPSDADLSDLACPALFLTGAEEPNSTAEMSRSMARLPQHGQAHIIEGAAHMAMMTHASDVNDQLTSFFATGLSVGSPSAGTKPQPGPNCSQEIKNDRV